MKLTGLVLTVISIHYVLLAAQDNPVGGSTSIQPSIAGIRYVTSKWNWTQRPPDDLGTPGHITIHLSPCPVGVDTMSFSEHYRYKVYIAGTGTPEVALVTGGTCTPGATSGTITVTTANSHAAGYTVGSSSSGIQEEIGRAHV